MVLDNLPTIDQQRAFWNDHWQNRAHERRVVNEWSVARFNTILELIRSLGLRSPRIVDLGCGPGYYTERLAEFGDVTGVDLSEEAIAAARARAPNVAFVAGNLLQMPLPRAYFDLAVSQEVLAHCEDQAGYVRRAADVLRPGGCLVLSTDNKFVMDRRDDEIVPLPPEHIDRFLTIRDLKRLLRPYFEVVDIRTRLPMGHRGVLRMVNSEKLNSALERLIPRRWLTALKERAGLGMTVIVLARKRAHL